MLKRVPFFKPSAGAEPENDLLGDSASSEADASLHAGVPLQAATRTESSMKWKILSNLSMPQNRDYDLAGSTTPGSEAYEEFNEADNPDNDFLGFVRTNSQILLPNQTTTRLQAMLHILTFVVAGGLNRTQVEALLKLLNTLMGQQVFQSSKYGFRE